MFMKKMENYCGARHEDVEHATNYVQNCHKVERWIQKQ
jgi:hypothetical protein